ncbi:MAG: REP-associated tyrosine transposase [Gammaproteobacteria bacterium]
MHTEFAEFIPGTRYFLTADTRGRGPVFIGETHVDLLRRALRSEMIRHPFEIEAWVIMPNHVHMIWRLPDGDANVATRWRSVCTAVAALMGVTTPDQLWQPRLRERVLRSKDEWKRHLDRLHDDPVRHGVADHPRRWPHSSYRACIDKGWVFDEARSENMGVSALATA